VTSLTVLASITVASAWFAQTGDVGLGESAALIRDLGALGVLILVVWLWMTGKLVRGQDHERVLGERNDSHERERQMHARIETDVIPAVTEMSRLVTQMLEAQRGQDR
jgi:hypothetical protein